MKYKLHRVFKKRIAFKSLLFVLICSLFFYVIATTSCSLHSTNEFVNSKTTVASAQDVGINSTTPTPEDIQLTETNTISLSATPTISKTTYFQYIDPTLNLLIPTIDVTQGPIETFLTGTPSGEYLYFNEIVKFRLADESYVISYLNLDDLSNNDSKNSDILIKRTQGSGGSFYSIRPLNNAVYFFPDLDSVDKNLCLTFFPLSTESGLDAISYLYQGENLLSGKPFCVITNEGRMAIVKYKEDSIKNNDDYTQDLSVEIIVYKEVLP